MDWIKTEDKQPAAGMQVLAWQADAAGYIISSVDEKGEWKGMAVAPCYWLPLPGPPMENLAAAHTAGIMCDIIDNRVSLSMDEQRETIAELMQYYISGDRVTISGIEYYVVDMQNEIGDSHIVTTFYFRPDE